MQMLVAFTLSSEQTPADKSGRSTGTSSSLIAFTADITVPCESNLQSCVTPTKSLEERHRLFFSFQWCAESCRGYFKSWKVWVPVDAIEAC